MSASIVALLMWMQMLVKTEHFAPEALRDVQPPATPAYDDRRDSFMSVQSDWSASDRPASDWSLPYSASFASDGSMADSMPLTPLSQRSNRAHTGLSESSFSESFDAGDWEYPTEPYAAPFPPGLPGSFDFGGGFLYTSPDAPAMVTGAPGMPPGVVDPTSYTVPHVRWDVPLSAALAPQPVPATDDRSQLALLGQQPLPAFEARPDIAELRSAEASAEVSEPKRRKRRSTRRRANAGDGAAHFVANAVQVTLGRNVRRDESGRMVPGGAPQPRWPCSWKDGNGVLCKKTFAKREHLRRHEKGHRGIIERSCLICHKQFPRLDNYQDHYKTHRSTHTGRNKDRRPPAEIIQILRTHGEYPIANRLEKKWQQERERPKERVRARL